MSNGQHDLERFRMFRIPEAPEVSESSAMIEIQPGEQLSTSKKPYTKPQLIVHGTVGELTHSGGQRQRDGIFTRAPS